MAKDGTGRILKIGQLVRVKINQTGEIKEGRITNVGEEVSLFSVSEESVIYAQSNKNFYIIE